MLFDTTAAVELEPAEVQDAAADPRLARARRGSAAVADRDVGEHKTAGAVDEEQAEGWRARRGGALNRRALAVDGDVAGDQRQRIRPADQTERGGEGIRRIERAQVDDIRPAAAGTLADARSRRAGRCWPR